MNESDIAKNRQRQREIRAARDIIRVGLSSYRKRMTGAKTKKQLADESGLFADLDSYDRPGDIDEMYGFGDITDDERVRLLQLWEAREGYSKGQYTDGVTELLERAIEKVGRQYEEDIEAMKDFEAHMARRDNAAVKRKQGFHVSE
ncbi:MAG: hypothetical protein FWE40_05330 [Oscillospiraceae bacterium]|nr:hypothetical protein [Oscillospiraceae bacterium]